MTVVMESLINPGGISGYRFFAGSEPVSRVTEERILDVRVVNDTAAIAKWSILRDEAGDFAVEASDGCRLGYRVKRRDEPSRIVGDLLLFMSGNFWDEP